MTDNRTNEPTEAQVEAAAEAFCESFPHPGGGSKIEYEGAEHAARAALVAAADAAPVVQQVSESAALALVEEVIAIHADRIGTHYEDCYKYHVACLAVAVKRRLGGESRGDRETD